MIFNISNCKYLIVVNVKSGNTRQLSDFSFFFLKLLTTTIVYFQRSTHLKSKLNHEPVANKLGYTFGSR